MRRGRATEVSTKEKKSVSVKASTDVEELDGELRRVVERHPPTRSQGGSRAPKRREVEFQRRMGEIEAIDDIDAYRCYWLAGQAENRQNRPFPA